MAGQGSGVRRAGSAHGTGGWVSALTILSDPKGDPPKLSEARSKRRASLKQNRGQCRNSRKGADCQPPVSL